MKKSIKRGAQTAMRWKSSCTHWSVKWYDKILSTTKVPDDLKAEAQAISCVIEPTMEEEDAEENERDAQFCVCPQSDNI